MSKHTMTTTTKLVFLPLLLLAWILGGCEVYEEEVYAMTDFDAEACEGIGDTLYIAADCGDLRIYGPQWSDAYIAETFGGTERIGSSWLDGDRLLEEDVYVFIDTSSADTVASMAVKEFVDLGDGVDSLLVLTRYNAAGTPSFAGLDVDTTLIEGVMDAPAYLSFANGLVGVDDDWDLEFDGDAINMGADLKVTRVEDTKLADVNTAPAGPYATNGSGFTLAMNTLAADTFIISEYDSVQRLTLPVGDDAGYMILDRESETAGDLVFFINNYMTLTIWDANGAVITPSDNSLSAEMIAYCPRIKTRVTYTLDAARYLVQFKPDEQMTSAVLRLLMKEGV